MLRILLRRLIVVLPTVILVSMIVFGLQKMLPGDPITTLAGEEQDPMVIAQLRAEYHLDDPLPKQYLLWMVDVLHGDLGRSLRTGVPVRSLIAQKLPVTLQLAVMALALAIAIGIPAGILSAAFRGSIVDCGANLFALSGMSVPHFWLGILMIMLVSVHWQLLPASGYVAPTQDFWLSIKTMLMPAAVLGTGLGAQLMRHTRSALLGVLRQDYIRSARARGLRWPAVVIRHGLRNALGPVITLLALLFGELLGGAVLTEQIFTLPGFGKLVVDAVFSRDYAVVQGVVLCTALAFILVNLLADLLQVALTPRMRQP